MSNLRSGNFPLLTYRNLDVGVTGSIIKNAAGDILDITIANTSAALRYVKLYDKATAPDENDTPIRTYPVPIGGSISPVVPDGIGFTNGISIRATTGIADNDTGAPTANDVVVNVGYL